MSEYPEPVGGGAAQISLSEYGIHLTNGLKISGELLREEGSK